MLCVLVLKFISVNSASGTADVGDLMYRLRHELIYVDEESCIQNAVILPKWK